MELLLLSPDIAFVPLRLQRFEHLTKGFAIELLGLPLCQVFPLLCKRLLPKSVLPSVFLFAFAELLTRNVTGLVEVEQTTFSRTEVGGQLLKTGDLGFKFSEFLPMLLTADLLVELFAELLTRNVTGLVEVEQTTF